MYYFLLINKLLRHDLKLQGSIAIGNFADIVVWEPEAEFHLNDDHPVYIKHPVYMSLDYLFIFLEHITTIGPPPGNLNFWD